MLTTPYGLLFCKAALAWCRQYLPEVDLIHGHDWQTALTASYLQQHYGSDPILAKVPFIFTIHNGAYQLTCDKSWFGRLGIAANGDEFLNMLEQGFGRQLKSLLLAKAIVTSY